MFIETFTCGFTLYQAMAALKSVVVTASPEAAQTGFWNFQYPLLDGEVGLPEERAEQREFLSEPGKLLIAIAPFRE